ncbi:MAG: glucose-6-phosphate isomerase [Pseudolysinimonas sp.]
MTVTIAVTGAAADAVQRIVPQLISDGVAGSITAQDSSLWGPAAEHEASTRLGWTEAVAISRGLVDDIVDLREKLNSAGVDRIVLCGMGGSSLAPEVITATYGVELVVLDSTDPQQVSEALKPRLEATAVVVSSKSGSTLETDSQKRAFEAAFRAAGIDPVERIVVVTDPSSPLDLAARAAGYRVFNADPNVGGRYSALTAFGLVPSGLAGVDIAQLLDEADAASYGLALDDDENPGLILGAALAGTRPLKDKIGIVADGTHIVGFGGWVEQLIAESTGKEGKGLLPVVLEIDAPELDENLADLLVIRLVKDAHATHEVNPGEVEIAGTLGAQLLTWEYAVAIAGRLLGIDPFDQPDVESAKIAARALIDNLTPPADPTFTDGTIGVLAQQLPLTGVTTVDAALDALLATVPADGYVAIHTYLDRIANPELEELRALLAARTKRPVTFGWGPRFLHSTGQYHKGGPANGVFLQIVGTEAADLAIPDRPFTFGQFIRAQAAGDASVLADHGRPVLTLVFTDIRADGERLLGLASQ